MKKKTFFVRKRRRRVRGTRVECRARSAKESSAPFFCGFVLISDFYAVKEIRNFGDFGGSDDLACASSCEILFSLIIVLLSLPRARPVDLSTSHLLCISVEAYSLIYYINSCRNIAEDHRAFCYCRDETAGMACDGPGFFMFEKGVIVFFLFVRESYRR